MNLKICDFSHKSCPAFSFVEIMVACAIFGVAFFALYSGITYCVSSLRFARENLRATQIMVEKLEAIRLYSWARLNDPTFVPKTFQATYTEAAAESKHGKTAGSVGTIYNGTLSISNAPILANYGANMRLATVNLTWTTGRTARQRSMQTFITRDGLYNYVY